MLPTRFDFSPVWSPDVVFVIVATNLPSLRAYFDHFSPTSAVGTNFICVCVLILSFFVGKMALSFVFLLVLFFAALVSCSQVVVLDSSNFEHQTQAAGDWLIQFYAPSVLHLQAMFEEIAEVLKEDGLVNVAKIDATKNTDVASRFNIRQVPSIIYISKGFVYQYTNAGESTTEDIVQFARSPYRRLDGTPVPPILSFQEKAVVYFKNIKGAYYIGTEKAMNELYGGVYFTRNQIWALAPFFVVFFIGRLFGKFSKRQRKSNTNATPAVDAKTKVLFGPEAARAQLEKAEFDMKAASIAIAVAEAKAKAAAELEPKQPIYDVDDWSSDDTGAADKKKKGASKKKSGTTKKKK